MRVILDKEVTITENIEWKDQWTEETYERKRMNWKKRIKYVIVWSFQTKMAFLEEREFCKMWKRPKCNSLD